MSSTPAETRSAPRVLACIDGSAYANSVCDHAAWMAGRIEAAVEVLNVVEARHHNERARLVMQFGVSRRRACQMRLAAQWPANSPRRLSVGRPT